MGKYDPSVKIDFEKVARGKHMSMQAQEGLK
jgi:hypothetical protein